jgi:glutaredoxin
MKKKIVLYSQPGCPPCFAARAFLESRQVSFEYKDVQKDPAALQELFELNSRSTPTLVIGEEIMIGFDPDRLATLLAAD